MRIERTFPVECLPAAALDYLADFGRAVEWDPGTQKCERQDDGPVRVGSIWANTSKLGPITTELTYELTEWTNERLLFVGTNKTATSRDTISLARRGDTGATLHYVSDVTFHKFSAIAEPVMRVIFAKLAKETVERLTDVLARVGRESESRS